MNTRKKAIDVQESVLRRTGNVLDILLMDRTTQKNILWATDSYENLGGEFSQKSKSSQNWLPASIIYLFSHEPPKV
jgi:hypothetical protein